MFCTFTKVIISRCANFFFHSQCHVRKEYLCALLNSDCMHCARIFLVKTHRSASACVHIIFHLLLTYQAKEGQGHEDMGNSHTVLHKELKAQYKSQASDPLYQAIAIQVRSRPIQDLDGCRNASGPALVAVIATWDASRRFESSFYENSSFEQKSCTALRNKKFSLVHS